MKERDFKGVWIPKEVWLSKDLTLQEKVFLVEIDSLDNQDGCFASNKYFAEFFGLTTGRCSQIINSLKEKGLISMEYKRLEGKKSIEKRIIRVFNKLNRGYLENAKGVFNKLKGGYLENAKDNNTYINNTINNTNKSVLPKNKKPTPISIAKEIAGDGKLLDAFLDFHEMRKHMKSPMTIRAVQLLFNRLDSLAKTEREKIELLEEATMNSWKSVYPKNKKKNDGFVVLENGREVSEITAHNIKIFQQMDEDKKNGKKGIFDGFI